MYPNTNIPEVSGVYILERPESRSFVEIIELRPDLYVCWTQVPDPEDPSPELDRRGNWSIGAEKLNLFLLNEEETEMTSLSFEFYRDRWTDVSDPGITLRKRSGMEALSGRFYFDIR